MDKARWQIVQEIFSEVLDLPAAMRRSTAQKLCAGDDTLFDNVVELIEEDSRGQSLLDSTPLASLAWAALDFASLPTLIERQIGPYHVIDLLGEGGMASSI